MPGFPRLVVDPARFRPPFGWQTCLARNRRPTVQHAEHARGSRPRLRLVAADDGALCLNTCRPGRARSGCESRRSPRDAEGVRSFDAVRRPNSYHERPASTFVLPPNMRLRLRRCVDAKELPTRSRCRWLYGSKRRRRTGIRLPSAPAAIQSRTPSPSTNGTANVDTPCDRSRQRDEMRSSIERGGVSDRFANSPTPAASASSRLRSRPIPRIIG